MKIRGEWSTRKVWIAGEDGEWKELSPHRSQAVWNHSPDGFNWGYGGSGPAQLALALLLEVTDKETAVRHHQQLKRDLVANLPQANFITTIDMRAYR